MPIPTPKPKEERQKFISRCISAVHNADPKRPQKQIIAICFDAWRKSKRKRTTAETKAIVEWYETKVKKGIPKKDGSGKGVGANKGRGGCPSWVQIARKLLASKKGSPQLRDYWKKRLERYEGKK